MIKYPNHRGRQQPPALNSQLSPSQENNRHNIINHDWQNNRKRNEWQRGGARLPSRPYIDLTMMDDVWAMDVIDSVATMRYLSRYTQRSTTSTQARSAQSFKEGILVSRPHLLPLSATSWPDPRPTVSAYFRTEGWFGPCSILPFESANEFWEIYWLRFFPFSWSLTGRDCWNISILSMTEIFTIP